MKVNQRMGSRKNAHFSTIKLDWKKPSPTITKTMGPSLCGLVHPDVNNMLSIPALKRCGSFPDEFIFEGDIREQWARIGNSVPPLFMKSLADYIKENILRKL